MKKSFLFSALLSGAAITAQAQSAIPAGTISLGGGIGYSRNSSETGAASQNSENTFSQFRITPAVGYFFADNLALGLNLGFTASKRTFKSSSFPTTSLDAATTLRVGPYVQYYKMLSDQFGVLGTLGAGYQGTFTPDFNGSPNNIVELRTKGFYANLTPGVIFFPIPKLGISASIGSLDYNRSSLEIDGNDQDSKYSTFGAGFGLDQLQFGGTFYFGR